MTDVLINRQLACCSLNMCTTKTASHLIKSTLPTLLVILLAGKSKKCQTSQRLSMITRT